MDFVIKGRTSVFLKDEVTENTYQAPTSEADAIEVLEDFSGFEYGRESIERSVLSNTVESEAPRAGLPETTGTLPTEFKAAPVEGNAPRANVLYKSLLGGKRNTASKVTDAGSTNTVVKLVDATGINAGDSILVKKAGQYAVRPVASVAGNDVNLAIALPFVPAAGVSVAAFTTYYHAENDTSFSTTAELGGEISEQATGCKVESAEIGNWATGQIPTISFALKALGLQKDTALTGITTDFSAEPQPPVALDAKAFIDGVEVDYNEFGLTLTNALNDVLSSGKPQGKIASRLTNFLVTGSINPYMETDNVDRFQKFNNSESSNLFLYVYNPTEVAGEMENVAAIWLPKIVYTAVTNGDADGVLTDDIEFQAAKTVANDTVFITFI